VQDVDGVKWHAEEANQTRKQMPNTAAEVLCASGDGKEQACSDQLFFLQGRDKDAET